MAPVNVRCLPLTVSGQSARDVGWDDDPVPRVTPDASQQMGLVPALEIPPGTLSSFHAISPTAISRRQGPSPFSSQVMPSAQDWEEHRGTITRLYRDERRSLKDVKAIMEHQYGFKPTDQMYKKQFPKWKIRRNLKSSERATICRIVKQRESLGKTKHQIVVRDQILDAHKFSLQARKLADRESPMKSTCGESNENEGIKISSPPGSPQMVQATIEYSSGSKVRQNLANAFSAAREIPCVMYPPGDEKYIENMCRQVAYFFGVSPISKSPIEYPVSNICYSARSAAKKSKFQRARILLNKALDRFRSEINQMSPLFLIDVITALNVPATHCFDVVRYFSEHTFDLCYVLLGPNHPITSIIRLSKSIACFGEAVRRSLRAAIAVAFAQNLAEDQAYLIIRLMIRLFIELSTDRQYEQAEKVVGHATNLCDKFKIQGSLYWRVSSMLGRLRLNTGDYDEAITVFSRFHHDGMGDPYCNLLFYDGLTGDALCKSHLDQDEEYCQKRLEVAIECYGIENAVVFYLTNHFADFLQARGKLEEAQEFRETCMLTDPLDVINVENGEGMTY